MKALSFMVASGLLLTVYGSGCRRAGNEPPSSLFVLQSEFKTVSRRMNKRGKPGFRRVDRPGEALAVFDVNLDGLEDFVVVNGTDYYFVFLNSRGENGQHVFRGRRWPVGPEKDGLRNISKSLGLHDLNSDGALDLHLCSIGKGTVRPTGIRSDAGLYWDGGYSTQLNSKDGSFVYRDLGIDGEGCKRGAVFEDFDGDGYFDAYISTSPYYGIWYWGSATSCQLYPGTGRSPAFGPDIRTEMLTKAPPDFWQDSEGNATINFKSAVVRDFDNDGQPDIATGAIADVYATSRGNMVSPEDGPGYQGDWYRGIFIFRNISTPGHIRFEDVSHRAIQNAYGRTNQMHVYSVVPADFNRDGRLDLLVTGPRGKTLARSMQYKTDLLRLYRNDSTPGRIKFTDMTEFAGLAFANSPDGADHRRLQTCTDGKIEYRHANFWVAAALDMDNDADLDIFATSPYPDLSDPQRGMTTRPTGWVFLNDGTGRFTAVSPPVHGLHVIAKEVSYGDLNNDGKVDIVASKPIQGPKPRGKNSVFFNNIDNSNNYIKVKVSTESNIQGVGANVRVYAAGTQELLGYDEVRTDMRYRSKKSTTLHFGLGKVEKVDIEVLLRDGRKLIRTGLEANAQHVVTCP